MGRFFGVFLMAVFGGILCEDAWAAGADFKLTALAKSKVGKRSVSQVTAMWQNIGTYRISVKNLSLSNDAANLTARYDIFVVRDDGMNDLREAAAHPQKVSESIAIPLIKAGDTVMVETKPVALDCAALTTGGSYACNARSSKTDKMCGVWVQLFNGEQMVGEFLSLPSLKKFGPF